MCPQPKSKLEIAGAPTNNAAAAAQANVQANIRALRTADAIASSFEFSESVCLPWAWAMAGKASDATNWIARTNGNSTSFHA